MNDFSNAFLSLDSYQEQAAKFRLPSPNEERVMGLLSEAGEVALGNLDKLADRLDRGVINSTGDLR